MNRPSREHWVYLGVAAIVALVAIQLMTPDIIGVFFDDAIYALVAKAVAEGRGFVYPQLPETPPAIHYPPLYPLLLAAVWRVAPAFPENVIWLKAINPIVLGIGAGLTALAIRRGTNWPPLVAGGLSLIGFIGVPMMLLGSVLFSEPLFVLLVAASLLAADACLERREPWRVAVAALAVAAVVLTRTIGIVLVPAVALALLWDRRWRASAAFVAVVAVLLLPWQLFVWRHAAGFPDHLRGSYGPYLEWVLDGYRAGGADLVLGVLRKNLTDAWAFLGIMFSPGIGAIRPLVVVGLVAFGAAGLWFAVVERRMRTAGLATAAYIALVVGWPYQIERFLWGLWPLLLVLLAYGVVRSAQAVAGAGRRAPAAVLAACGALLFVGQVHYSARGLSRGWATSASANASQRILPAVRLVAQQPLLHDKLLMSDVAPAIALYTGHMVMSLDLLKVTDHLAPKSVSDRIGIVEALDRRVVPDAYVLLADGPLVPAFLRASLPPSRRFVELAPGVNVRAFLLEAR